MKVTKQEFVKAYESYIEALIEQQAKLTIETHSLQMALARHYKDECDYNLSYEYDDDTGVYSYKKIRVRKIGFIGGENGKKTD